MYLYFVKIHFFFTDRTLLKIGITDNIQQRMYNFLIDNDQKYVSKVEIIKVWYDNETKIRETEKLIIDNYSIVSTIANTFKDLTTLFPGGRTELIANTKNNQTNILNRVDKLVKPMKQSILKYSFNIADVSKNKIFQEYIIKDFKSTSNSKEKKNELYSSISDTFSVKSWGKTKKPLQRKYFMILDEENDEYKLYFLTKHSTNVVIKRIDDKGYKILEGIYKII